MSHPRDSALDALRHEVAALTARVAALEADRYEKESLRNRLLTAIATRIGPGVVFSAIELRAHARVDRVLAGALAPAATPKQIGRRLRTLAGHALGAMHLVRIGRDENGCLWQIEYMNPLAPR